MFTGTPTSIPPHAACVPVACVPESAGRLPHAAGLYLLALILISPSGAG